MKSLNDAGRSFRDFFDELRGAFFERETLLAQIELALLCREHVLVTGPPGTAKSAIASAVLGRIVDRETQKPSLFAKQISELTVQTDLIGAVDFKVLTETGRTEYLTEDGMLGATHAFLDEVFDGRDMLLRSVLNVLHERELKHGRKVTPGRTECVIMTSNRYLSEVLARSPELLLAFADRLSFISFVPKAFGRPHSRASMLHRASTRQRIELRAQLTLQELDVLQKAVEEVHVSSVMVEALEGLADRLEKELLKQVARLPDYVPTKYFSHRSVVKALWALKAAVVRDRIYRHPDRPLEAVPRDLDALRLFFLLGGPDQAALETLLAAAVDPRERAQLEILRLEHKAFDQALALVLADTTGGVAREAHALGAEVLLSAAEAQVGFFDPGKALDLAGALRQRLIPGPRHPDNRNAALAAARMLLSAVEARLARGPGGQKEEQRAALYAALRTAFELVRDVPELGGRLEALTALGEGFCAQALELLALEGEGAHFEGALGLTQLAGVARRLDQEVDGVGELTSALALSAAERAEHLATLEAEARRRAATALRQCATRALEAAASGKGDLEEALGASGRALVELEEALVSLSPAMRGLKQELLAPVARRYVAEVLEGAQFSRADQLAHAIRRAAERLQQEGLPGAALMTQERERVERRLGQHAQALKAAASAAPVTEVTALSGAAYQRYRQELLAAAPDGELRGVLEVERALGGDVAGAPAALSAALKEAVATVELSFLQRRVRFLSAWLAELLETLPNPAELSRQEADGLFDKVVKTRFPLLTLKEGELVRLSASLRTLAGAGGKLEADARGLQEEVTALRARFDDWSRRLLEARGRP